MSGYLVSSGFLAPKRQENIMRSFVKSIAILTVVGSLFGTGCAYGGIAAVDSDTVVVLRNDSFLFGLLRKAVVCDVTPSGLANCVSGVKP
jgi:hypothetical protein